MTRTITRREMLAWALAIILAVTAVTLGRSGIAGAGLAPPPGGSAGQTEVVYIATGENFPDALAAAATAALGVGPVLLVQHNNIPTATMNELTRLQPPTIYLMGGLAAISSGVEADMNAFIWDPEVIRIGGANRYETAAMLSNESFPTSGKYPRVAADSPRGSIGAVGPGARAGTEIEAPAPGTLVIHGNVNVESADAVECSLRLPGPTIVSTRGITAGESNCVVHGAIDVAAGTHSVVLFTVGPNAPAVYTLGDADLTVTWIPFDGDGMVPEP